MTSLYDFYKSPVLGCLDLYCIANDDENGKSNTNDDDLDEESIVVVMDILSQIRFLAQFTWALQVTTRMGGSNGQRPFSSQTPPVFSVTL